MKIWLVTVGEPVFTDPGDNRLLRAGILSQYLAKRGHETVWWTSSFNHMQKCWRRPVDEPIRIAPNLSMVLLSALGYRRNISARRIADHWWIAQRFRKLALRTELPDVIMASYPPVELCDVCGKLGRRFRIPVVLDVRDLWPDVFLDVVPKKLRRTAARVLPYRRMSRVSCRNATGIVAPADSYIDWAVGLAGRKRTEFDQVFPFGYVDRPPDPARIADAEALWTAQGIAAGDGKLRVCFLGTLGRQFDLDSVIEVARELQCSHPAIEFVICGDGDKARHYREKARDCGNIKWPGWVDYTAMWMLMRRCSIGLAPYQETANFAGHLPNKPIEYLSAGLPVLSSLKGSLEQLLHDKECGLTYSAGDRRELKACLLRLAQNPAELAEMSGNARRAFRSGFDADAIYPQIVDYLEHCQTTTGFAI
jgi:glycosyltransferase involved in cell wall biosynthesis